MFTLISSSHFLLSSVLDINGCGVALLETRARRVDRGGNLVLGILRSGRVNSVSILGGTHLCGRHGAEELNALEEEARETDAVLRKVLARLGV